MAKIRHNKFLDTVDEIFSDAKNKGVFHLYTEDEAYTGRKVRIKGKDLFHFGTTGYLGLEQDPRLKKSAIEAILRYGTQFPLSKTYVSFVLYSDLEEHLHRMYQNPVLVAKNSTLCHLAVIPSVVRDEDVVILDHQVHNSVQSACTMLKPRGIPVDMIKHSNLNMLEDKIKEYGNKYRKVWYMIDGVYSMFGDVAPIEELTYLLKKYPLFNLYVDDVHGMSWAGKHGTGYVLSKLGKLPDKVILVSTLSKSFGASGATMICADKEISRYVKNFGGPLSFSAQLEPPSVAAALASAQIHLSDEIYEMQNELKDKITYCNALLKNTTLPLIDENLCPVFFIGTGLPAIGFNLANRLMNEGYYVNLGVFPAVPVKNTGIRFTISRHNKKEDIKGLIDAMVYHHPKALEEANYSPNRIRRSFNLPLMGEDREGVKIPSSLVLEHAATIDNVDPVAWDNSLGKNSSFDRRGLKFFEDVFANNDKPEDNWSFDYFIVKDTSAKVILATYFTTSLWKDDMLSPASVSIDIELKRTTDSYYLTSRVTGMGSLISEGDHLYIDKNSPQWKEALVLLLNAVYKIQEKNNATMVVLRDFEEDDQEIKDFFQSQGFIKIHLPESCVIEDLNWESKEEFLQTLSANSRAKIKKDVFKYEHFFDVEIKHVVSEEELAYYYQLFSNVKSRNFDLNSFTYPKKLFSNMRNYSGWEFMVLKIKPEFDDRAVKKPVAVAFNYFNDTKIYNAVLIGLDYEMSEQFQVYRQAFFVLLKNAKKLGAKRVNLGFSASIEKRKFGARIIPKVAYVQAKDNFNLELIESMSIKPHSK
ncbi:aminotransferase class I/II-fold pyridoxal phosphate-dependent enzyme [Chryseosolibacter indicus]|uniref:Aminotransferase class I/II-fold pyridoxal phosphate-dependent enzyme n=1 Tax=Chryseosolibacter indicus TaxID=2782351 RepID=A0ABS5VQ00_9BACT|nr:aminotransferase class I/II-fold pyridoxal phosphate-dependent enzyme [Chryseosolibacter indicus]MBT1703530.1 aminotransferase class I/II-fold pyridoxal phosphate-dependent enzyme [Chryseosolibacter indicus]